jgi:radical SAM peptide maturase (CXXX-repeat target family)
VQAYLKKHLGHLSFSISVDGNKALHDSCRVFPDGRGSYDLAISGVTHFTQVLGGTMGSKMTLAPSNVDKTAEAVIGLLDFGYRELYLNCVYEEGWQPHHAQTLYRELKRVADYILDNDLDVYVSMFEENIGCPMPEADNQNWCGGTGYMISVDWKGDLYPCIRYMESSLGESVKPVVIGNVDTGLASTKEQIACVACLEAVTRRSQSAPECFSCPIARGCAWCSAYNYQRLGSVNKRATFICLMHQARCLANVYYWNRLFIKNNTPYRFDNNVPEDWALKIISENELQTLNGLIRRPAAEAPDALSNAD